MNTNLSHDIPILRFCLLWILATTTGATATLLLADFLSWLYLQGKTEELAFQNDNAVGPIIGFAFGVIVLLGPSVGLAQAFVLRRFTRFTAWKGWWLASSLLVPTFHAIALAISLFLSFILKDNGYMIFGFAALSGLAFGLAQPLLVPTHHMKPSGRWAWVAANVIAWPLGVAGGLLAAGTAGASYFANATYQFPFYPLQSAMYWTLGWVVGAVIFSALTGMVLAWLLSRQGSTPEAELPT